MARIPNPSLLMMMNNNEVHPVELLVIGGLAVVEAVMVLAVALAGLVLTVAGWRPSAPTSPAPLEPPVEHSAPMAPMPAVEHCAPAPLPPAVPLLATLAGDAAAAMAPLNVAELRRQARAAGLPPALTRNGRRDALLMALAGLEVACC